MDKRIVKSLEHIHANLVDQLMTVSSLAVTANSSVFHLSRLFKAAMGCPSMAYAKRKRSELATEMFAHRHSVAIVHVALKSGFGSQSHLSTAFKKEYGISPAAFRKNPPILKR